MHRVVATLTALALLMHVVLGCCAHHLHAAEVDGASRDGAASAPVRDVAGSCHACCCHHHATSARQLAERDGTNSPSESESPNKHRRLFCLAHDCSFTVDRALDLDGTLGTGVDAGSLFSAQPVNLDAAGRPGLGNRWVRACRVAAPPLRAHLVLQVLLI